MMLKETITVPLLLVLLCSFPKCVTSFEPVSGITLLGGALLSGFIANFLRCRFGECCTENWIKLNATELNSELDRKLHGQHLVKNAVVKHIKAHLNSDNPSKALSFSFHGGTGTGKNYVSKIIAEHVYKLGLKSKFVHILPATKEFQHENMVEKYKDKLKDLIETSTAMCERSLFIFDEMDKMPYGLIDTVKPYLDFHEHLDGVNYRKTIFIFLSNTAGQEISRHTLDHWHTGKKREDIKLSEMENLLTTAAVNTKNSGLWHSDLLTRHMISALIPFLPLERRHVKKCVKDNLLTKKIYKHYSHIADHKVQEVMNELSFYPEEEKIFSVTGCKRVAEKVDYVMEELD